MFVYSGPVGDADTPRPHECIVHAPVRVSTRNWRHLFRKRYVVLCWSCDVLRIPADDHEEASLELRRVLWFDTPEELRQY